MLMFMDCFGNVFKRGTLPFLFGVLQEDCCTELAGNDYSCGQLKGTVSGSKTSSQDPSLK